MTIRPTPSGGFRMVCDECGNYRDASTAASVNAAMNDRSEPMRWRRIEPDDFSLPTEHRCPKCAAVQRSDAT